MDGALIREAAHRVEGEGECPARVNIAAVPARRVAGGSMGTAAVVRPGDRGPHVDCNSLWVEEVIPYTDARAAGSAGGARGRGERRGGHSRERPGVYEGPGEPVNEAMRHSHSAVRRARARRGQG